jgi:hypothetical protein
MDTIVIAFFCLLFFQGKSWKQCGCNGKTADKKNQTQFSRTLQIIRLETSAFDGRGKKCGNRREWVELIQIK